MAMTPFYYPQYSYGQSGLGPVGLGYEKQETLPPRKPMRTWTIVHYGGFEQQDVKDEIVAANFYTDSPNGGVIFEDSDYNKVGFFQGVRSVKIKELT